MDDSPYINDGADTSLRKTVSLLNKIEDALVAGSPGSGSGPIIGGPVTFHAGVPPYTGGFATGPQHTTNEGKVLFPEKLNRKFFLFQNLSGVYDMYLTFSVAPRRTEDQIGMSPVTLNAIKIAKNGGGIILNNGFIPTQEIRLFCTSANQYFVAVEG
jgi:hypothetical protein